MAEPHSTAVAGALGGAGLIAALTGVVGQVGAGWATVLFASILGAGIAVGELETKSAGAAWWTMFKGVALALLFAAGAAEYVSPHLGMDPIHVLWPLSGFIAWQQGRVLDFARALWALRKGPSQ